MDLSSFLSSWISSFGCSQYFQTPRGITFWFFGDFHRRFSRDSPLISSTAATIAVRRSVWTCKAFYRREYRRSAFLDTFKPLSASLSVFSGTFTADSHKILPLISCTAATIAVRRSVSACPTFCHHGYHRSALLDTFKSLSALLWSFSGTYTADSREITSV